MRYLTALFIWMLVCRPPLDAVFRDRHTETTRTEGQCRLALAILRSGDTNSVLRELARDCVCVERQES